MYYDITAKTSSQQKFFLPFVVFGLRLFMIVLVFGAQGYSPARRSYALRAVGPS